MIQIVYRECNGSSLITPCSFSQNLSIPDEVSIKRHIILWKKCLPVWRFYKDSLTQFIWHYFLMVLLLHYFFPSLLSIPLKLVFFGVFILAHWSPFSHLPWWYWRSQGFGTSIVRRFTTPLLLCSEPSPSEYKYLNVPQAQYLKLNTSSAEFIIYSISTKLITLNIFPILNIITIKKSITQARNFRVYLGYSLKMNMQRTVPRIPSDLPSSQM